MNRLTQSKEVSFLLHDVLGKSLRLLADKKLFLLDLDGTFYLDQQLLPGAKEFLTWVREHQRRAIFVTNNSSKSVSDYIKKMAKLGIATSADDFYTSSMAMARYLNQHYPHQTVFLMGTQSLAAELVSHQIPLAITKEDDVDIVVLGYDTELTYQKLIDVSWLLKKDLVYLATNPDYVCPVDFGYVPDCGAIAEMLWHSTGKMPHFIGKPDPLILHCAMEQARMSREDTVVIGDRLYTDIKSGQNAEVTTVAVLSGEATLNDILQSPEKPDYVVSSIKDIWLACQ